ncbi:MAG: phosphatidylglycerophosphatase A [Nitrospiraceae bacterium]|nr:phosphatidylglycerophosphatase A [Nitrospiraceae bacterium]
MNRDGFGAVLLRQIATLSFIGYSPAAPGTMGSLAAALFVYLIRPRPLPLAVFTVFTAFLGAWAAEVAEKRLGRDSSHIIIDEFAGYLLSVLFIPHSAGYLIAAFVLFRALDILKPPPIRRLEKLPGGMGVMADDLAAGAVANLVIQLWAAFS